MDESPDADLANAALVSPRWVEWRRRTQIDDYDARFERSLARGGNVHGEADFIAALAPTSVLDAGCGTGRITIELTRRGFDVTGVDLDADMIAATRRKAPQLPWIVDDLARMQLPRRFSLIAMPGNVMLFCQPEDRRLIVHNLAQHLEPGGLLVAGFELEASGYTLAEWDAHCEASGLTLESRSSTWEGDAFVAPGRYHVSVHRREDRFNVHDLVAAARLSSARLSPLELADALSSGDAIAIDTRQTVDRRRGFIAGSLHMPRTVLEWRVDPASGYADPAIQGFDQRLVVYCNDGYSSSLAAANLRRVGFVNATDLIGGFEAWNRAGLPISTDSGSDQ